ncbi:hypothetical protein SAMN04487891_101143 [Flagellimonas taeanensis]|jgi:hypothetical protein|uniref:Uncharacterized protein n=1 Tax=Flagellimonas taeanensis TaxID=1005926 RepID=A0A1M6PE40_9FLAO|nr:hypothetical protein SAMN04487891_101143 [Allomuricauda taeanensis]SHK06228.1 hypothetical protein SAMN05216293_0146 [Allomuricauda taeanensis]
MCQTDQCRCHQLTDAPFEFMDEAFRELFVKFKGRFASFRVENEQTK